MKNTIFFLLILISCKESKPKAETQLSGKEIFIENNCATCHQIDQKVLGPSLNEIAKVYKKNKASISVFLKGESDPIVDKLQFETMKLNLETTKTMTDSQLQALENYIKNPN